MAPPLMARVTESSRKRLLAKRKATWGERSRSVRGAVGRYLPKTQIACESNWMNVATLRNRQAKGAARITNTRCSI